MYGLTQALCEECKGPCTSTSTRFVNSLTESTLYVQKDGEKSLIVVLCADDWLISVANEQEIADFKADLSKRF